VADACGQEDSVSFAVRGSSRRILKLVGGRQELERFGDCTCGIDGLFTLADSFSERSSLRGH
jgi:hypothetical protein